MKIKQLTLNDLEESATILTQAFSNDPLWHYMFKKTEQLKGFFKTLLEIFLSKNNSIGIGEPLQGIALIEPPTGIKLTIKDLLNLLKLIKYVHELIKASSTLRLSQKIHNETTPEPHYYINFLAVKPEFQGKGIGTKLLHYVQEKSRKEKTIIYLDTMNPENVEYYKKKGFKQAGRFTDEKTGITIWAFLY